MFGAKGCGARKRHPESAPSANLCCAVQAEPPPQQEGRPMGKTGQPEWREAPTGALRSLAEVWRVDSVAFVSAARGSLEVWLSPRAARQPISSQRSTRPPLGWQESRRDRAPLLSQRTRRPPRSEILSRVRRSLVRCLGRLTCVRLGLPPLSSEKTPGLLCRRRYRVSPSLCFHAKGKLHLLISE